MQKPDKKLFSVALKLIGLGCIAAVVFEFAPQYSHHLLLAVSVGLLYFGSSMLFSYRTQKDWIEKVAIIKSIHESQKEVAESQYSKTKYYYPVVKYEYVADGVTHHGDVVSLEKENVWVPEVGSWGDPLPPESRWWINTVPGDELPVFVNPRDSREAVLIKDLNQTRRSHHLAVTTGGALLALIWAILEFHVLS